MSSWAPKSRRQKFELHLKIIDLNNVPLVSGTSLVKWHLPHSAAAEHRGRTSKRQIKDHKVSYDYEKVVPVRLFVDKSGLLQEAAIYFEVLQEYSSGSRGERIVLGNVTLNLAEYVGASEGEGDEGVCRRYLMQHSKINSTLKVSVFMKFLEGDRNFTAPPLKNAPVFGGIAGIIAGEQGEPDDVGHMPSLSSKSREAGELQDMYRRTLAAFWTAQPGELKADDAIENIFAGGDGWGNKDQPYVNTKNRLAGEGDDVSSSRIRIWHQRNQSGDKGSESSPKNRDVYAKEPDSHITSSAVSGRGSLEQHATQMKAEAAMTRSKPSYDVDEFDIREDLRSWKLPEAT